MRRNRGAWGCAPDPQPQHENPAAPITSAESPGIVAGYDGSAHADDAVRWAAREAQARDCALTVCLVQAQPQAPNEPDDAGAALRKSQEGLEPAIRLAREQCSAPVRPLLVAGSPAAVLCSQSQAAEMLVIGSRGHDCMPGLPLGPVSMEVAAQATGTVVVIRGDWQPAPGQDPLPIVVGVDGSACSQAAVPFAFEEAALRETWLLAVCALADDRGVPGGANQVRADFDRLMSHAERQHPDVAVRRQVSEGTGRQALLDAGARAQLVVVGARGRGGVPGMPLGSVSMAALAYADSPVAVVRMDGSGLGARTVGKPSSMPADGRRRAGVTNRQLVERRPYEITGSSSRGPGRNRTDHANYTSSGQS